MIVMPRLSATGVLITVCVGVFLASLDQTSVVTALPEIMLDMGISIDRLDDMVWVVTAYLLGFTVAMPFLGRAGDIFGYRRLYLLAVLLFGLGSVLVALADGLGWLIAARVVQAIGGGALIPGAIALTSERLPAAGKAIVFGIVGAAAELGAVIGPLYGGYSSNSSGGAGSSGLTSL
jgi:MFS family permease